MALTEKKKTNPKVTAINAVDNSATETEDLRDKTPEPEASYDGFIDLSETRRKKFHVNRGTNTSGDLYLNTSDLSMVIRLEEVYPKLQKLVQEASIKQLDMEKASDEEYISKASQTLKEIDSEMRRLLDRVFDSNVSEVCAPEGSLFDPFNGEFRFEHIIQKLSTLYEANVREEFAKMSMKIKRKTSKYTKGR